jgi:hypothetical protein
LSERTVQHRPSRSRQEREENMLDGMHAPLAAAGFLVAIVLWGSRYFGPR